MRSLYLWLKCLQHGLVFTIATFQSYQWCILWESIQPKGWPNVGSKHVAYVLINKNTTYQILCILTTVKHIGIPLYTQHQWLSLTQAWGWPNVGSKHVAYVLINKNTTYQILCILTTVKHIGIPIHTQHQRLSLPQTWGWPNVGSKHVAYVLINK